MTLLLGWQRRIKDEDTVNKLIKEQEAKVTMSSHAVDVHHVCDSDIPLQVTECKQFLTVKSTWAVMAQDTERFKRYHEPRYVSSAL